MQRNSKKRTAVLDEVKKSRSHPTAQDVWLKLRPSMPQLSLATVYRNLSEFVAEGQIRKLDGVDGQSRFDGDLSPHAHFSCTNCGAVCDIPVDATSDLCRKAEDVSGCKILGHELVFYGLCKTCSDKKDNPRS